MRAVGSIRAGKSIQGEETNRPNFRSCLSRLRSQADSGGFIRFIFPKAGSWVLGLRNKLCDVSPLPEHAPYLVFVLISVCVLP